MSYFAVSRYLDQIKIKEKRDELFGAGQLLYYDYFDNEADARTFIIGRAERELAKAAKEHEVAKRRLKKCMRKFANVTAPERQGRQGRT